jgi:glycosyltransferase involved in cell wall biosynthesis
MRVLHVIPSISNADGGPSHILALIEQELCAEGVSVTTLTTDDDGPGCRLEVGARPAEVHGAKRVYCKKWFDFYKVAPGIIPWLWYHVRAFDLVHIHSLFSFASVVAGLVAHVRGVPYVVRPLGTLNQYGVEQRRPWLKWLSLALLEARILSRAAAVHFTSEREWEETKTLNLELKGVVIPLAVKTEERGDTKWLLQNYPILADCRIILYLSRLDPKKNLEGLLRAFAFIRAQQDNVVLLIGGDGQPEYVSGLKRLSGTLGIAPHIVWLGDVRGAHKSAAHSAAQIFVLPSFSENFGIAAAEAMLAGLPCVLGRGIAIAEQVQKAGAGIVVSPEPDAIARVLVGLLRDHNRREAIGQRARIFALQEYSSKIMTRRLIELYETIAARRRVAQ